MVRVKLMQCAVGMATGTLNLAVAFRSLAAAIDLTVRFGLEISHVSYFRALSGFGKLKH